MASFRKRGKKGKWEYRINYRENGKRKTISKGGFDTKSEAKVEADRIEHELNTGLDVAAGYQPFPEYYKNWIDTYKIGMFSESTDRVYKHASELVTNHFPDCTLNQVTRERYQKFINEYSTGKARETVRKMHVLVGSSLRDAFHSGYIQINPTHKVTIHGDERMNNEPFFLHADEIGRLLHALKDDLNVNYTTRYMLILQLATGMRISEVMAIQFKDLDFLNNTVNINKSWDYKFTHDFKPTKNRETRKIKVDKKTMKIIKELYDYKLGQKVVSHRQLLFTKKDKMPTVNAVNGALKRACVRANVSVVTSHALRHTHASYSIYQGVDVSYISERLGHRDTTVTYNTYIHVLNELKQKSEQGVVQAFDALYD